MSIEEYYLELARRALGWIGWPPDIVMQTDVNIIEMALRGREGMLSAIFGSPKGKKGKKGPVTAKTFHDFVKRHNRARAKKDGE